MPTIFTHAFVGLGIAASTGEHRNLLVVGVSMALATLPDLDIVGFYLGVPYRSFFGHRGFSHSICCAVLVSLAAAWIVGSAFAVPFGRLGVTFALSMASHGLLDAFTDGGEGIALLSPFTAARYFFPWRPIRVSFIGFNPFSRRMLHVLGSELLWVWLLVIAVAVITILCRDKF